MKSRTKRINLRKSIRTYHNINGGGEKKFNFIIKHSPSRWRLIEEHARKHMEKLYSYRTITRYFTKFPWSWYIKPIYTYIISIIVKPPEPKSKERSVYLFDVDISEIEISTGYMGVHGNLREIRGEPPVPFFDKLTKLKKKNLKVNEFIALFINNTYADIDEQNDAYNCIDLLFIAIQNGLKLKLEEYPDDFYFIGLSYLNSEIEKQIKLTDSMLKKGNIQSTYIPKSLNESEIKKIIDDNLRSVPYRYVSDQGYEDDPEMLLCEQIPDNYFKNHLKCYKLTSDNPPS
jgi:hypothetical protein